MTTLRRDYTFVTILYTLNLICTIYRYFYTNGDENILFGILIVPIAIPYLIVAAILIGDYTVSDVNAALPFAITIKFLSTAIFANDFGVESIMKSFGKYMESCNIFIFWLNKVSCIIFTGIPAVFGPLFVITMISPVSVAHTDDDLTIAIFYQFLSLIPCIWYYVQLLCHPDPDYISWIAFFSCMFHSIYFLFNVKLNKNCAETGNPKVECLDFLSVIFVIIIITINVNMALIIVIICIFAVSVPIYKSDFLEDYKEWLQSSPIIMYIKEQTYLQDDAMLMNILYCYRHNTLAHSSSAHWSIASCMKLHREWNSLSIEEKHGYLVESIGKTKYFRLKWSRNAYFLILMIHFMIPTLLTVSTYFGNNSLPLVMIFICIMFNLNLIWIINHEWKHLVLLWRLKDVVLIQMIEQAGNKSHFGFTIKWRIKNIMKRMNICALDNFLPPELNGIINHYLSATCIQNP